MSARKFQAGRERSATASPDRLRRNHTSHSSNYADDADVGRGQWAASRSYSSFERSGENVTIHQQISVEDDEWMCDYDTFDDNDEDPSVEEAQPSSWLCCFLEEAMEGMGPDVVDDPSTVMPCPASRGGPGGSVVYRGFAEILEEDLRNRGARFVDGGVVAAANGRWEGLGGQDVAGDRMIVWPPMVVVLNTRLDKDNGSDKWLGMGKSKLLDYFKEYEATKAKSAYGRYGHCGVSVLIFDCSVVGFNEAERLHKHFIEEGRGKYDWENQPKWKDSTRKYLLYGYMPTGEEDLSIFNKHCGDKQKLKYEMKSYQIMVGNSLKEMFKNIQKQPLPEIKNVIREKLRLRDLEIEVVRTRAAELFDEHNKEIESLIECYDEKLKQLMRENETLLKAHKSMRSSNSDQNDRSLPDLPNLVNVTDVEHDGQHTELDEIITEQAYLDMFVSQDKKQKKPLLMDEP